MNNDPKVLESTETSVLVLGTLLIRSRSRVIKWMLAGGIFAALSVAFKPALFSSTASFVPVAGEGSRSGLANLAGQFGVSIPGANQALTPDFYAKLVASRVLLLHVVRDSFVVREENGRRVAFLDLFEITGQSETIRQEQGAKLLKQIMRVSVFKMTGVVEFSVATRWPSVSTAIAGAILRGVDVFNVDTKQGQAGAERKFVEARMASANADLRQVEDRLETFLKVNRQLGTSPELSIERDRIQREVAVRQQVVLGLTQAYEDARIREVRDTPVVTVFEPPSIPVVAQPRGRLIRVLVGIMLGGVLGALWVFLSTAMTNRAYLDDASTKEFLGALEEARAELLRGWIRSRK